MFRRVATGSKAGSKGVKLIAAALLLLVLFAWAGSNIGTSVAEDEPEKPGLTEPAKGTEDAEGARKSKGAGWDGFKNSGPDLPVERLVITMVVLVGGAGLAFWLVRRFGVGRLGGLQARPGGGPAMKLVGRLPLGGRRGLVMVRAAGRLLVLGISEAGVQKVLERADEEIEPEGFDDALERLRSEEER